jgi:hypothetical protein
MADDKDSAVPDSAMLEALQKDADIPHLPTQETYQFRMAVSGQGPLAYQWSDKPHRLLYDACSIIESQAAMRQPTQSDALREALEKVITSSNLEKAHEIAATTLEELRQPTQSDALVAALVEASEGLKQDLLNRAEWDDDAKVVCAGAGAWSRFTTALAALQEQSK